jgi:capsular polysaccharide biosynthesis protein
LAITFLGSVVAGILLGLGAVYAMEQFDRRIRSVDDLAEMLELPVLGVIHRTRPMSPRLPYQDETR